MAFPATYNFSYYKGDTFELNVTPRDNAGNDFDLTGYTATFTVADQRGPTPTKTIACFSTTNNTNVVQCVITPANSADEDFPTGSTAVYDVQISKAGGSYTQTYTLLTGTVIINPDITGAT